MNQKFKTSNEKQRKHLAEKEQESFLAAALTSFYKKICDHMWIVELNIWGILTNFALAKHLFINITINV